MPLPDDFERECLYTPDAWFVHDLISVDRDHIVARTDTTQLGALVAAQRPWPGHPKHLPGALSIQITGTLGALHAIYGLDLRPTQGWAGFGIQIIKAKFGSIGEVGPPIDLRADISRVRNFRGTVFIDYAFEYTQEGRMVYTSKQTAAWRQGEHRGPCPEPS